MRKWQDPNFHIDLRTTQQTAQMLPDIELIYIISGSLSVHLMDDSSFVMKREDVLIINANMMHEWTAERDSLYCVITFSYALFYQYFENTGFLFWCNSAVDRDGYRKEKYEELRSHIRQLLLYHISDEKEHNSFKEQAQIYEIVSRLVRDFLVLSQATLDETKIKQDQADTRLQMINSYIYANYSEKISLEELANQLYLSQAYLSRYIRKHFGMTFSSYVTSVRLKQAMEFLLHSTQSITRIAADSGFSSLAAFNQEFHNVYGMSPSRYREQYAQQRGDEVTEAIPEKGALMRMIGSPGGVRQKEASPQLASDHFEHVEAAYDPSGQNPYLPFWRKTISIGSAQMLLDGVMQRLLSELHERYGITYVRFWNLFYPYFLRSSSDTVDLNFSRIDAILDLLKDQRLYPMIELADKPYKIHSTKDDYVLPEQKEADLAPEKLVSLVMRLLRHYQKRYGYEYVSRWCLEVAYDSDQAEWSRQVFEETFRQVRREFPEIAIGGGGIRISFDDRMLGSMPKLRMKDVHPDFLSFILFHSLNGISPGRDNVSESFLREKIRQAADPEDAQIYDSIPLYITEWNLTLSDRNFLNDSAYKAAYIVQTILKLWDQVGMLAYFGFHDYTSSFEDRTQFLYGGSGVLSQSGIPKPASYAFRFLRRLSPYLLKKGEHYLVTTDCSEHFDILCHNCMKLSDYYFLHKENEIMPEDYERCFEKMETLELEVALTNIPNGLYELRRRWINEESGSILHHWRQLNCVPEPDEPELFYLEHRSVPEMSKEEIRVEEGRLRLIEMLQPNEIRVIQLFRKEEY